MYSEFNFLTEQLNGTYNYSFIAGGKLASKRYLCPSDATTGNLVEFSSGGKNGVNPKEDMRETNIACISDSVDWSCDGLWPKLLSFADGMFGNQEGCGSLKCRTA